jgi:hypothetical protein
MGASPQSIEKQAMINTGKVANRRTIKFSSIDEILADADVLCRGRVRTLGNWTAAQIVQHVADLMHASLDGMDHIRLPWYMRAGGRLFKRNLINGRMPPGFKSPRQMASLAPRDGAELDAAMERLRSAAARFRTERATTNSPFLGPMTHDDWVKLHCRHAELHFSFMQPGE